MTLDCKNQILSSIIKNRVCSLVFLNAIFTISSEIKENYILICCNNDCLEHVLDIMNKHFQDYELHFWKGSLIVNGNIKNLLKQTDFENFDLNNLTNEQTKLIVAKIMFLTNGNFYYTDDNLKNSTGYRFEISFKNKNLADSCLKLYASLGFELKETNRGAMHCVYSKNSNQICAIFVKLNAQYFALEIQNALTVRELRNNVNRQNNCFESNLEKTIVASGEQIQAINYILDNYSIDYLDENLREVALARIANPDATLNELKTILNNKLSRAGIKYRLDKIIELYKKLKGE